jgi:hypothetical protein
MAANLRRRARRQTRRAYRGQRRAAQSAVAGARDDMQDQVASLNTMQDALLGSLRGARQQVRGLGLQGDDRQAALRELAMRMPDVVAGTQMQIQQAREEGQESILAARQGVQDVAAAQATATQERLADLQKMRMENRAGAIDDQRDLRNSLLKDVFGELLEDGGAGGADPERAESRKAASQTAIMKFRGAKDTPELIEAFGEDPKEWNDAAWAAMTDSVAKAEGVDQADAIWAVERIRRNVQGDNDNARSVTDQLRGGQLPGFGPQTAPQRRPAPQPQQAPPAQGGGGGGGNMQQLLQLLAQAQKPGFSIEDLLRLAQSRG